MWPFLLLTITMMLFLLPLLPALHEWRLKRDISPLKIVQTHTGHTDYYSEQFWAFIQGEIAVLATHTATSDPSGNYCFIEASGLFKPNHEENQCGVTRRVVLASGDLRLPDNLVFSREVYGNQAVQGGHGNHFRAILAEHALLIGPNSMVLRWAHARTIHTGAGCHLLGRLSAEEEIVLEPGCTFTRVHAPCVRFGSDTFPPADGIVKGNASASKLKAMLRPLESGADGDNRWLVDGDLEFPANGVVCGDIVARGNVLIHQGAEIIGSIKANGTLRIKHNVTITGALISSKDLVIEGMCTVAGPVVAERQIDIHSGTVIGTATKPTTVSAPVIRVTAGAVVYGTVWAREQGWVLATKADE